MIITNKEGRRVGFVTGIRIGTWDTRFLLEKLSEGISFVEYALDGLGLWDTGTGLFVLESF